MHVHSQGETVSTSVETGKSQPECAEAVCSVIDTGTESHLCLAETAKARRAGSVIVGKREVFKCALLEAAGMGKLRAN